MKRGTRYLLPVVFIAVLFILIGCSKAPPATPSTTPVATTNPPASSLPPTTPASTPSESASIANGQRIYNTAASASGQPITYAGGPNMMMQGALTCATCHGPEGQGGTVYFMMQSYDVPDITWPVLSGPDPDMQHPPYTEETLKRAITEGLDPGGGQLEYPMPRWQMSAQDLNDLAAYIMTLK